MPVKYIMYRVELIADQLVLLVMVAWWQKAVSYWSPPYQTQASPE